MPVTQSPFQMPQGPQITPRTMTAAGQGGQAQPPYLQMRTQAGPPISAPQGATQQPTQPVVSQQPTAPGDSVKPALQQPQGGPPISPPRSAGVSPGSPSGPPITPANPAAFTGATNAYNASQNIGAPVPGAPAGTPPQAGGQTLGDVYKFFQSDLQNQTNQALASAKADAAARGVYYGTPLTGSEADINTQYLRGLGQLQAGMYGNEQQNTLARLGLASNLGWQNAFNQPPSPGPMDWSSLGAIFGNQPSVAAQRTGPVIGNTTPGQQGQPVQGNPGYAPPWMR
jgi:hypothetical protein